RGGVRLLNGPACVDDDDRRRQRVEQQPEPRSLMRGVAFLLLAREARLLQLDGQRGHSPLQRDVARLQLIREAVEREECLLELSLVVLHVRVTAMPRMFRFSLVAISVPGCFPASSGRQRSMTCTKASKF